MMDYTPMEPASEKNRWHAFRDDYLLMLMLRDSPGEMRVYDCVGEVRLHVDGDSTPICKWGTCDWRDIYPLYERTVESYAAYIMAQDAPTELKMDVVSHLHTEMKSSSRQLLARKIPIALYLLEKER